MNKKEDSFETKSKEKSSNIFNKNNSINSNNENNFSSNENIDFENNNTFNINNNYNTTSSLDNSAFNKKLTFSLQSKPFVIKNKKINQNSNDNNSISNNINGNNYIKHNLSKFSNKKNDLLTKIKEKLTKENLINKNYEKIDKNNSSSSKSSNTNIVDEPILDSKIDENPDKKDSNDDEDDILSEQKDEMEEGDNNLLKINKVDSVKIHSSFFQGHNYTGSGFSINSNTSSNKSSLNKKSNTEPNNPQLYINNDCHSGRSNNSGNHFIQIGTGNISGGYENYNPRPIYNPHSHFGYHYKNSFLSTHSNSQKIDSSYSSESGQSPLFLGNIHSFNYNNTITNMPNNSYMYPVMNNFTPVGSGTRHVYTSSFNSNESIFSRQLFSVNTKQYNSDYKFGKKKENQIINLENVALGKEKRTTVMIRNIPIKYDTTILEKELEPFEGKYDCLYMPYDYDNEGNKGYAFLNLTNPYHVLLFYEYFNNKCWMYFDSKKMCTLNYANFQGIEEIKKHAKNYKGKKKPVFFICTKDEQLNNTLEIPMQYIHYLLSTNPKMKYRENKMKNTFIVESFN